MYNSNASSSNDYPYLPISPNNEVEYASDWYYIKYQYIKEQYTRKIVFHILNMYNIRMKIFKIDQLLRKTIMDMKKKWY